jgi:hypothetical protein
MTEDDLPPTPHREGALAYKGPDGAWVVAGPGDPLFSTMCSCATHVFVEANWVELL